MTSKVTIVHGHWVHNGMKTTKVAVRKQGIQITKVVSVKTSSPPDENSQLHTLVRVYYVHDPHEDFKRTYNYLVNEYFGASINRGLILISKFG